MRVGPGGAAAAEALVQRCCPAARRRPQRWQAGGGGGAAAAVAAGGYGPGSAPSGGAGALEPVAAAPADAHLSFSIPQGAADLPALFAALEEGRCVKGRAAGGQSAPARACLLPARAAVVPQQSWSAVGSGGLRRGGVSGRRAAGARSPPTPAPHSSPFPRRASDSGIQEYSLSQTTLESVFLQVAGGGGAHASPGPDR